MNLKRFSILSAIIVAIMVITTIVLSCVKIDNPIGLPDADIIMVYSKTSSGSEFTKTDRPEKYNRLKEEVKNMTKLSVMDCMINDWDLHRTPSQDVNNTYKKFDKYAVTPENYCVELIYEEKQELLIEFEGDTRVIPFYALLFVVQESEHGQEIALYFSTTEGLDSTKTYSSSSNPILIKGDTTNLFEYITSEEYTG